MTRTRSGKIADTRPQASRRDLTTKSAKAAQRSIDKPSLAIEHAERSGSASSAAIADGTSTCTENATEGHTANNPVPSAPENPAPTDLALPTDSTTSAAVTCEADSVAEQNAPPVPSTQPVVTAANDLGATTSAIADAAFTESTAEDHAVNNPVSSASEDSAPCDPALTKSMTSAVSTGDTNDPAEQHALPMPSTQPVNTTTNDSVPLPSTSTASTADAVPPLGLSDDAIERMSTIANDGSEMDFCDTAGHQGSPGRPSDKSQTLARTAGLAEPETGKTKRKSERRARKRGAKPVITTPNSPGDPIIVDDDSDDSGSDGSVGDGSDESVDDGTDKDQSDDAPIARSIKQVLRYRQRHLEKMKSSLDNLIAYIGSTADSDQSGDYNGMRVGEKRSFEDFVAAELDDSDQPKTFANDLLDEIREYQGMLRRTKRFHRQ